MTRPTDRFTRVFGGASSPSHVLGYNLPMHIPTGETTQDTYQHEHRENQGHDSPPHDLSRLPRHENCASNKGPTSKGYQANERNNKRIATSISIGLERGRAEEVA